MHDLEQTIIESTTPHPPPSKKRFRMLLVSIWAVTALLIIRGFYLQVIRGLDFRSQAERNRVYQILIPAPRGIIYDRNGTQLVENIPSTDLILDPALLPNQENEAPLIEHLTQLLPNTPPEHITRSLEQARRTSRPTLVEKALDHDIVLKLEESQDVLTGTRLVSSLVRKYPYSYATSHIIGYTSAVTPQELERDTSLYPTDTTGKQGIEKTYDSPLRGTHGISYTEVNAAGRPQTDLGTQEPIPGQDIQLTIDIELQQFIYGIFSERNADRIAKGDNGLKGAVVLLDPVSGAILSMLSYPSFDQNIFSQPALKADATSLFEDKDKPLFNRAVDGTYPSGSIIKPFLAAAALEEGIITEHTTIYSSGGISIGRWHFSDWKPQGHGVTDVKKAIAESVNTFFYVITGGDNNHTGLGVYRATKYLRLFGWAKPTGVDLPSEASGFLPSPEWKKETFNESWYIGDTYHLGIGQGNVLVTPLQVAAATASIANGGSLVTPHFINKDQRPKRIPIARQHIQTVQEGMRLAITEGSGRSLTTLPMALAGKTGTAEIGGTEKTHAWFTSFGPYEDPKLVVTVLLEEGGRGDADAVPIAKEIWSWWIENGIKN